jgi:hypothetical protein
MRYFIVLVLILIGVFAVSAQTVAFTNVNVIPMDKERVLQNQTGLIKNGFISEIGMNSFHLVRTADGWKLGNSISTIEPQGCTEKEKGMVKNAE